MARPAIPPLPQAPAADELWRELLEPATLRRGWDMAAPCPDRDDAEDLLAREVLEDDLDEVVRTTGARLADGTFAPQPLLRVDVPKGPLATRPGSLPAPRDRMVLCAIAWLLARRLDRFLPDGVHSWRLARPLPASGSPFREDADVFPVPADAGGAAAAGRAHGTAAARERLAAADPFEPWNGSWRRFDDATRAALADGRRPFLAVTDVAAYFESVRLPVLRGLLARLAPGEARLADLACTLLAAWAPRDRAGRPIPRGLPSNNKASSFLGSLYLLPIDEEAARLARRSDVVVVRYMDNLRVAAPTAAAARHAMARLVARLRGLHLHVQASKTHLLAVDDGSVERHLGDERTAALSRLVVAAAAAPPPDPAPGRQRLRRPAGQPPPAATSRRRALLRRLAALEPPAGEPAGPGRGHASRALRRWITAHLLLGSTAHVDRLLDELRVDPDPRLARKLVATARAAPRLRRMERPLLAFLASPASVSPHQEAEILRALRGSSRVSAAAVAHAAGRLHDETAPPYLRMQAAWLLARSLRPAPLVEACVARLDRPGEPHVRAALAAIALQRARDHGALVERIARDGDERLAALGSLVRALQGDPRRAAARLAFLLDPAAPHRAADQMALLVAMAASDEPGVRRVVRQALRPAARRHPLLDVRETLAALRRGWPAAATPGTSADSCVML